MCESVFKTAGEQQGNGMGTAWERHCMCESALKRPLDGQYFCPVLLPLISIVQHVAPRTTQYHRAILNLFVIQGD
jgi:hypothetical protein